MTDNLKTRIAEAIAKQLKYGFRGDELDIFTDDAVKAVLDIVEPLLPKWGPISKARKSGEVIGIWKGGKWYAAELWYDDLEDSRTDKRTAILYVPTRKGIEI